MADWTDIQNESIEPDAPVISSLMFALRDNPVAIAEGASGAPRVANAAFNNGTIGAEKLQDGTAERDWVLARTAVATVGAVGTYALLRHNGGSSGTQDLAQGDTASGGSLSYTNVGGGTGTGGTPSGTWRVMGRVRVGNEVNSDSPVRSSLWLRIS